MKKLFNKENKPKKLRNKALFKRGGYAIALTAIVIVGAIVLNILVGALSERFHLTFDLSSDKINSASEENIEYIKGVKEKVTISLLSNEDDYASYMDYYAQNLFMAQDSTGEYYNQTIRLLNQYADYNENITLRFVDPQEPEFAEVQSKYASEDFVYGDILVETTFKGENNADITRHKVLSYSDIYNLSDESGMAGYGYGYYTVSGSNLETVLTSAIASVTSTETKTLAYLKSVSSDGAFTALRKILELNNYAIVEVNDEFITKLPENIDGVLLIAPKRDLTGAELDVISKYLKNDGKLGGSLIYFASIASPALPNFNEFLLEWGIKQGSGMLFETNKNYLLSETQPSTLAVLPTVNAIFGSNKYFICSNNVPFTITETVNNLCKVTALANTSDGVAIAPVNAEATWIGAESAEKKSFPVILMSETQNFVDNVQMKSYVMAFSSFDLINESWLSEESLNNLDSVLGVTAKATGMADTSIVFTPKTIETDNYYSKVTATKTTIIRVIFQYTLPVLLIALAVYVFIRRKNK